MPAHLAPCFKLRIMMASGRTAGAGTTGPGAATVAGLSKRTVLSWPRCASGPSTSGEFCRTALAVEARILVDRSGESPRFKIVAS